jgi:RNA polymerase sigma-70 factor (ECF subfamily)
MREAPTNSNWRLEELLERYLPAIQRLAWSYVRSVQHREDLVQEIAVALWKAIPAFRGDCSERTYVYRIAHNIALRFATSNRREQGVAATPETEPVSTDNPEGEAIRNQRRQRLWNAIEKLPLVDRQIAVLHLEGLPTAEIVDVTGFSEGMVAMRLSRLRRKLTEELNPKGAAEVQ